MFEPSIVGGKTGELRFLVAILPQRRPFRIGRLYWSRKTKARVRLARVATIAMRAGRLRLVRSTKSDERKVVVASLIRPGARSTGCL